MTPIHESLIIPLEMFDWVDDDQYAALSAKVCDQNEAMAKRMRAVFTLRSIGSNKAVDALQPGKKGPPSFIFLISSSSN